MNRCTYVRRVDGMWEFGHISITDVATKKEKRTYVPAGTKASYEEALNANFMALTGLPRMGTTIPYFEYRKD